MKLLLRFAVLYLATIIVGCLPSVESIDPSTIIEWENYGTFEGLAGNQVNCITEDSQGNLWIGTDKGVSKYDGNAFANYNTSDGLINNFVTSIVEFEPGLMVFGTDAGLSIFENGDFIASDTDLGGNISPPYSVISLGIDSDGLGWIGTNEYGLWVTNGVAYKQVWDSDCMLCNLVNDIYLDSNGVLWFATYGDLESLTGNTWNRYTTSKGLPNNRIQSIFEDSWGTLWVGTYNGLARRRGNSFEEVDMYNSASQNWAYTISQDNKNNLWFGSIGNGLIYSDGATMRTEPTSLEDSRISSISSFRDSNNTLWIGTYEGGLWKYTPNQ